MPTSFSHRAFILALAAAAVACGGADQTQLTSTAAPADPGGPPAAAALPPVVLVLNRVCTPEDCNHYLYALPELPASGVLDRSQGIELGDSQAAIHDGFAYIFDRFNLSVTRWSVDAALTPRPEETVSFQATGVTQLDAISNVFVSPTRAFILDAGAGVLVTWNPSSMEIVAVTNVPDPILAREGAPLSGLWPIESGGRVFFAASWYDFDGRRGYEKAALLSFASDDDAPTLEVLEDDRCGITASVAPFADEAGDVYFAGDWYLGLNQIGVSAGRATKPACLLRVPAGTGAVDPNFYVDLLAAADARAITSAIYLGAGRWLMNVWPTSVPALTPAELEADPGAYFAAESFEYVVVVDLAAGTRIPVSGMRRGSYGGLTPMFMDGLPYVQVFPSDGATQGAALYEVRPTGAARQVLSAGPDGDFEFIGRLR